MRLCLICGKILKKISPSALKRGEGRYCSHKCRAIDQKGKQRLDITGEKNKNWKGDNVTVNAIHMWVKRHKPKPKLCEKCNEKIAKQLSNISRKYLRDINDFEWLCVGCHKKKDLLTIENGSKPMSKDYLHSKRWD